MTHSYSGTLTWLLVGLLFFTKAFSAGLHEDWDLHELSERIQLGAWTMQ